MVSIVAQLHVRMQIFICCTSIILLCTIQITSCFNSDYKRPMRYPFTGCFLGANVAVQCLSVRVRLRGVIGQNGVHRAHTVHPRPLCPNGQDQDTWADKALHAWGDGL